MATDLKNVWYVAAWEWEIAGEALLARTLLGVPRVMFRRSDGGYALLRDRCPHRFAPLSLGRRTGDVIACRYHGLEFGPDGRCVHHPAGDRLPPRAGVESLPVVARHGLLWFWPGEAARADPATIPDFSFLDGQNVRRCYSHFRANYELLADNLMDLSHVDFLHRDTFQTTGTHAQSKHEVRDGAGETLWNTWLVPDVRRYPILDAHFRDGEKIDQLTEMRWDPPASMRLRIAWRPAAGAPGAARFEVVNPHIVTPETASTSHYFWSCEPTDADEAFARRVFEEEDGPMLEAAQSRMGGDDFWNLEPLVLRADVGAIRARRRLERLRRTESGAAPGGTD